MTAIMANTKFDDFKRATGKRYKRATGDLTLAQLKSQEAGLLSDLQDATADSNEPAVVAARAELQKVQAQIKAIEQPKSNLPKYLFFGAIAIAVGLLIWKFRKGFKK